MTRFSENIFIYVFSLFSLPHFHPFMISWSQSLDETIHIIIESVRYREASYVIGLF